jgi:long-chain acyl-CoA synthetase
MGTMTRDEAVAALTGPGGPFEIVDTQIGDVSMRVYESAPPSLVSILESSRGYGDREFLVFEHDRVTFSDHYGIVAALASWLAGERGIGKGDRIAIGMRNYPEWLFAFWATLALGAVAVPLNAWWSGPELRYALDDSGATFALLDGERYDRLAGDLRELRMPSIVVRHQGAVQDGAIRWPDLRDQLDRSVALPDVDIAPDDDATILYTSGTTGQPKGAVGTHRNHLTNYMNSLCFGAVDAMLASSPAPLAEQTVAAPPCSLQTYPFFHIGGLTMLYMATGAGVKLVLQYKWDLEQALELIEREHVTSFAAVPTILRQVFDSPLMEKYDVSSLTNIGSGGTPVPPDLVGRVDEEFDQALPSNGYGLTETTSAVTVNRGADYLAHPSSVGRVFPVVGVRVVDPTTGSDVTTGSTGELWFRGPNVVRGYWNRPAATAEAFTDGWFHSGDLGFVDDEGFLHVVDRLKDLVIRSGENVYCAEVEAAIFEHPAVADVAVVGLPHRELGEQVAAVVQLKEGSDVSAAQLQEHVAARLARFKVPEHVVIRTDPLPRTASGKVLKRDLRDQISPR